MENGAQDAHPSYRQLVMWQKAHEFLTGVLIQAKEFPQTEEARIIKRQLLRAAMSVPANIVEGYGGMKGRSFTRYLRVSRGSAWEADYWLFLASRQGCLGEKSYQHLRLICGEVIAILTSAIRKRETSNVQ